MACSFLSTYVWIFGIYSRRGNEDITTLRHGSQLVSREVVTCEKSRLENREKMHCDDSSSGCQLHPFPFGMDKSDANLLPLTFNVAELHVRNCLCCCRFSTEGLVFILFLFPERGDFLFFTAVQSPLTRQSVNSTSTKCLLIYLPTLGQ